MNAPAPVVTRPRHFLRLHLAALRSDRLFMLLLVGFVLLTLIEPGKVASYPMLVDWPTIAALTGLLTLTKGIEASNVVPRLADRMLRFLPTERAVALTLVTTAAVLSTVLTNDVALFVTVPLTLSICRITGIASTKLIVFEALAVNAGSALTPIGNPQNIFLWQGSSVSFGAFTLHMLPLVLCLMALLLMMTSFVFRARLCALESGHQPAMMDRLLLWTSLLLYVPFLIFTDLHHAGPAVVVVMAVFLLLRPKVLMQLDWGLLLVFVLMFIDLRLLASLDGVRRGFEALGLDQAAHVYAASIAASQLVSNVPAVIALAQYTRDWQVLAYGVNIGGFGLMLGSLANLIALRMTGDRQALRVFHLYSVPSLLVAALIGYLLLTAKGLL